MRSCGVCLVKAGWAFQKSVGCWASLVEWQRVPGRPTGSSFDARVLCRLQLSLCWVCTNRSATIWGSGSGDPRMSIHEYSVVGVGRLGSIEEPKSHVTYFLCF